MAILIPTRIDNLPGQFAAKRSAAKHAHVGGLFIDPRRDIHGQPSSFACFAERAYHLQPIHDTQRAVQPTAGRLGIGVRPKQQSITRLSGAANDITDTVDFGVQACLAHTR